MIEIALAFYFMGTMPETGFRPAPREDRGSWQAMGATLSDGIGQVRSKPILIGLFGIAAVMGLYSEGVDRLSEPHFLQNFEFPVLFALEPVLWLGAIRATALLLGFAGTSIAKRYVDPSKSQQARLGPGLFRPDPQPGPLDLQKAGST